MTKNDLIKFRVSSKEKEDAQFLIEKLGYKNLSSFFRDYLNELLEFNNKDISELEFLETFYQEQLSSSRNPGESFFIKRKLSLIKEFKEVIEKEI